jgi:hypothetical protein
MRSPFCTPVGRRTFLGGLGAGVLVACEADPLLTPKRVRTIEGHPGERLELTDVIGSNVPGGRAGLAMDPDAVYFVRPDGVYTVPRTGGPARRLAESNGAAFPRVDGDFVYWSAPRDLGASVVRRVSRFGSDVKEVVEIPYGASFEVSNRRLVWAGARGQPLSTYHDDDDDDHEVKPVKGRYDGSARLVTRWSGVYWEDATGARVSRLGADGRVTGAAPLKEGERFLDADDEAMYGIPRDFVQGAGKSWRWFRRPFLGGPDREVVARGYGQRVWAAGRRTVMQEVVGDRSVLSLLQTNGETRVLMSDERSEYLVDEWGIFWQEATIRDGRPTNQRFYYLELPA